MLRLIQILGAAESTQMKTRFSSVKKKLFMTHKELSDYESMATTRFSIVKKKQAMKKK
jgi:hypothetical protein